MQESSPRADVVAQLINTDLENVDRLIELLREERRALENRDVTGLQATVQDKLQVLMALDQSGRQRDELMRQLGIEASPANWRQHLGELVEREAPGLGERWKLLLERLQLCGELTEINSRIVSRTQHSLGKILDLLRGQHNSESSTYDNLGRSTRHYDNRPITLA